MAWADTGSDAARSALGDSLTALLLAERAALDATARSHLTAAAPVTEGAAPTAEAPVTAAADGGETVAVPRNEPGDRTAATAPSVRKKPAALPGTDRFAMDWLLAQPVPKRSPELDCLATALYFEARGEGIAGQAAVAEVILNRTGLPTFPGSVCAVVRDGAGDGAGGCQFSYACDGRSDTVTDRASYGVAERIAAAIMAGAPRRLTDGATHFHNDTVRPSWAARFARTARIGEHTFYRMPIRTASN
jgi:spore germination cell wall hydrolase CwlJ-like protein